LCVYERQANLTFRHHSNKNGIHRAREKTIKVRFTQNFLVTEHNILGAKKSNKFYSI